MRDRQHRHTVPAARVTAGTHRFCCLERRVASEVAGDIHDRQGQRAAERAALLAGAGRRGRRLPNADVQSDAHRVLATIRAALREP